MEKEAMEMYSARGYQDHPCWLILRIQPSARIQADFTSSRQPELYLNASVFLQPRSTLASHAMALALLILDL